MTETKTAPESRELQTTDTPPVPIRGEIVAAYEAMFLDIPEAGGDGMSSILEQIASATTAAALDAPWTTDPIAKLLGVPIVVTELRRLPSDFDSGLGWFLVVDAAVRATGEKVTFTTGSLSIVAQLAKWNQLGRPPTVWIPRRAERPSKGGFYPLHLEVGR